MFHDENVVDFWRMFIPRVVDAGGFRVIVEFDHCFNASS